MMKSSEAAKIVCADLAGGKDTVFENVSTDSRTIQSGSLFIALHGPHFDGNDFVNEAEKQGAVVAIVSRLVKTALPLIFVNDTLAALTQLACHQRERINVPAIAVTGSCGKTTTRALLSSVFRQCGNVLASERSFNNNIGVPLTLLRLRSNHDYAIFELGANQAGEIAYLTNLAKPSVAIITNVGHVHLEGFGSLEGVAKAKGEIFEGLPPDGTAIINNDDHFSEFWQDLANLRRVITFGLNHPADVMADDITLDSDGQPTFRLILPNGQAQIQLPLIGIHNVNNALAAAATAYAQQLSLDAIKAGLENVAAVNRRLIERKGYRDAVIIDDSYNANPLSVSAAIAVLAKRSGHSILVLGDMLELGEGADRQFHQMIGERSVEAGIKQLYCYGHLTKHTAGAFGKGAYYFDDQEKLLSALKNHLNADAVVLIKGSLAMKMDHIAKVLFEK